MDKKTIETLHMVQSPNIMKVLKNNAKKLYFDEFSSNAHNMGNIDENQLRDFVKEIYKDECEASGVIDYNENPMQLLLNDSLNSLVLTKSRNFLHVKAYENMGIEKEDHDLSVYLNLKIKNVVEFSRLFYEKLKELRLPGYFKFSSKSDFRNDTWVLSASYDNLNQYLEIIENIKNTHPELMDGAEMLSPNVGVINGYIGIAEESNKTSVKENYKKVQYDYNEKLKNCVESIYLQLKKEVENYKNSRQNNKSTIGDESDVFGHTNLTFVDAKERFIDSYIDYYLSKFKDNHKRLMKKGRDIEFDKKAEIYKEILHAKLFERLAFNGKTEQDFVFGGIEVFDNDIDTWLQSIRHFAFIGDTDVHDNLDVREMLTRYNLFGNGFDRISEKNPSLLKVVKREFNQGCDSALEKNPQDSDASDLLVYVSDLPADKQTKFFEVLSSNYLNAIQNGVYNFENNFTLPNGKVVDANKYLNTFKLMFGLTLGKDKIKDIITDKCKAYRIDPNKICFNATTSKLIEREYQLQNDKEEEIKEYMVSKDFYLRNPQNDLIEILSLYAIRTMINDLCKSRKRISGTSKQIENIDVGVIRDICDVFDYMFSKNEYVVKYKNKQPKELNYVIKDLFLSNDIYALNSMLNDNNIPQKEREMLEKLRIAMPMYESAYIPMLSSVINAFNCPKVGCAKKSNVAYLKSLQCKGMEEEYYKQLKMMSRFNTGSNFYMAVIGDKDGEQYNNKAIDILYGLNSAQILKNKGKTEKDM